MLQPFCMVMEYVAGTTLRKMLAGQSMELARGLDIVRRIADGMAAAHDAGIVHRDLKTENILISDTGEIKIADFGVAKQVGGHDGTSESRGGATTDGSVLGTCRAMSPEQALGRSVDMRSDLFSFGVLLYEVFTGRSPFLADNDLATIQRVIGQAHEPAHTINPTLPRVLSRLIDQLLAKNPVLRTRNFAEVQRDLAHIADMVEIDDEATGSAVFDHLAAPVRAAVRADEESGSCSQPGQTDPESDDPATEAGAEMRGEQAGDTGASDSPARAVEVPSGSRATHRVAFAGVLSCALALGMWSWSPWSSSESSSTPGEHGTAAPVAVRGAATTTSDADSKPGETTATRSVTYVAVLPPEMGASSLDDDDNILVSHAVRQSLLSALVDYEGVVVQTASAVDGALHTRAPGQAGDDAPPSLPDIVRALDADVLVQSSVSCPSDRCEITLNRIRRDGTLAWTQSFSGYPPELSKLGNAVIAHVRNGFTEFAIRSGRPSAQQVDDGDYRSFLQLYDAHAAGAPERPIIEGLADIRARSPNFINIYLLEADLARLLYANSREQADIEHARRLSQAAQVMAPDHPEVFALMYRIAFEDRDFQAAEVALDQLERVSPGAARVPLYRAWLVVDTDVEQAMKLQGQAMRRSSSWSILHECAEMAYRYGRIERARGHLLQLLEQLPGNREGMSLLARLELMSGSPQRAATLYEKLAAITPDFMTFSNLGTTQLLLEA